MTGPLKTVACKRCGRAIAWVRTESGNRMPLDPLTSERGNVFVSMVNGVPTGAVASKARPRPPGVPFVPHFGTCPALNPQRPDRPPQPPKPDPPPALELDL